MIRLDYMKNEKRRNYPVIKTAEDKLKIVTEVVWESVIDCLSRMRQVAMASLRLGDLEEGSYGFQVWRKN